jgi:hypothetical protein
MLTTPHPKIMRAQETHLSELEMASLMQALRHGIETRDMDGMNALLRRWVERATSGSDTLNLAEQIDPSQTA